MRRNTSFNPSIDALIMPTSRAGARIDGASRLAETLGCALVVLGSKSSDVKDMATIAWMGSADAVGIEMTGTTLARRLPGWRTSGVIEDAGYLPSTDLSMKRNLALLLAHQVGWTKLFFLDDDISIEEPNDIRRAGGLMENYAAVGLTIGGFPDCSVIGHVVRGLGDQHREFLGGGAIAVTPQRVRSFFPEIYNEDRMYLLNASGLSRVTMTGRAIQDSYDPFDDPTRAGAEEFGEVIAGGLYYLSLTGALPREANQDYWRAYKAARDKALVHVLARTRESPKPPSEKQKISDAIYAARQSLAGITPELCAAYVVEWHRDQVRWQLHLRMFPTGLSIREALAALGLTGITPGPRY
ncbi:MAG TPA: hypothetical protein VFV66_08525 [Nonomuraea sp.]|nr:hypothetical protein [Nonomuraea sp.]